MLHTVGDSPEPSDGLDMDLSEGEGPSDDTMDPADKDDDVNKNEQEDQQKQDGGDGKENIAPGQYNYLTIIYLIVFVIVW